MAFHHALKINENLCIGCTHCIMACPTQALRVKEGKARLIHERCVDCGECMQACPVNAITIEEDDFERIFHYPYRVALVPSVVIGQFARNIATRKIYSGILEEGFTHVYEAEHGAGILIGLINDYLIEKPGIRPVISSLPGDCKTDSGQISFAGNNILPFKAPLDLAAISFRRKLAEQGIPEERPAFFMSHPVPQKLLP